MPRVRKPSPPPGDKPFPVVGVGASAGGLEAMRRLLAALGPTPGIAIIYVQHLDPAFESSLTELFASVTQLPVVRAEEGLAVRKDQVFIAAPHAEIRVENGFLQLAERPAADRFGPIDRFFASLAADFGSRASAVVLSGTLADGAQGICKVREAGGVTFAQDEGTAKFDGMPKSAAATGCVDFVLPPEGIAAKLQRLAKRGPESLGKPPKAEVPHLADQGDALGRILNLVWSVTGTDFHGYKRDMVLRRVTRQMEIHRAGTLEAFADLLRDHPDAVQNLYQDLLIPVTDFFRDPLLFRHLKSRIYPELAAHNSPGSPVRIWVPGCSTGQEAYSIAISLLEHLGDKADSTPIQIFGTDLSEFAVERARAGLYGPKEVENVSADRLTRFFRKDGESYRVSKRLRDLCIFARQNLLKDPPFSRMDLVSCQNVLIYLDSAMQRRAIEVFHYALCDRGHLVLGAAESVGAHPDLFAPVSKKYRIFQKRPAIVQTNLSMSRAALGSGAGFPPVDAASPAAVERLEPEAQREADRALLALHAPPGVLVNDRMEIIQFRGPCSPYVEPLPGVASLNLYKMLNEDLAIQVRQLIPRAVRNPGKPATLLVHATINGADREVELEVLAVKLAGKDRIYFLVMFGESREAAKEPGPPDTGRVAGSREAQKDDKALLTSLHRELTACKEQLRAVIEDGESKAEELKSAMEEVTSANEELQSINEELETAKEELQSTNEELSTINEELQNRNVQLSLLNADINNFISSVEIPILMLANDATIRRYTPAATRLLNVIPSDAGRPLSDLRLKVDVAGLDGALRRVPSTGKAEELAALGPGGRRYEVWVRPFVAPDNEVDGLVVAFFDVSERQQAEERLAAAADGLRQVLSHMPVMLVAYDEEGFIAQWNEECERVTGYSAAEMVRSPEAIARLYPDLADVERTSATDQREGGAYREWRRSITRKDGTRLDVHWSSVGGLFPVKGWSAWEVGVPADSRRE